MNKKECLDIIYCILKNDDWEVGYMYDLVNIVIESSKRYQNLTDVIDKVYGGKI